ncbi:MAG: hypothetical protein ACKO5E_08625 [bacterium]
MRVRFGPLLRWFFVGFFLFAEIFLATRVWGGWRPKAIGQLLAIQIFFAPRLLFAGFAFAAFATVFTDRLVKWVAKPLSARWLTPMKGLPPEPELPLFLRVGERLEKAYRARRKIEHSWEPGWLLITDQRLFWLSGVWRMTSFELPRGVSSDPVLSHLDFDPAPHWLAGFVVGMPPRILIDLNHTPYSENSYCEVIAMASPKDLIEHLQPGLISLFAELNDSLKEKLVDEATLKKARAVPKRSLQRENTTAQVSTSALMELPPRRERKVKPKRVKEQTVVKDEPITEVRGIQLPPRRRKR